MQKKIAKNIFPARVLLYSTKKTWPVAWPPKGYMIKLLIYKINYFYPIMPGDKHETGGACCLLKKFTGCCFLDNF
jgi:hypothetical protein